MLRNYINNLRLIAILLFCWKVTAADHNSAVQNHYTNPCPHLGDELTTYLARLDEVLCCVCPKDSYYVSPCDGSPVFNNTVCKPCREGTGREFSLGPQGIEMCKPIPTTKPKSTTPQPTQITSTSQQNVNDKSEVTKPPGEANAGGWVWVLLGVLVLAVVGFSLWCFIRRSNLCRAAKEPIHSNSVSNVEAGPDASYSSVSTGKSSQQTPLSNKRDSIVSETSSTPDPSKWKNGVQYKQIPESDPGEVITERVVIDHGQATPRKQEALPLRADYPGSTTVSEVPTASRVPQPVYNTDDTLTSQPEPSTCLPVIRDYNNNRAANVQTIKRVFFSMGATINVKIETFQVQYFGSHHGLVEDQISLAKASTEGNAAFLCEVFTKIVSMKGNALDLNEVVNFFKDNAMKLIYDHLVLHLNR
uniref:Uncharacterized protein LOC100183792 n=1 Tax=Phallusia mammillata TaxID=59560 RepID=A0A6F9DIU4_9ASCI|nr:uncharacterized protein LOC100183792 [Phallusia mammillata]